MVKFIVVKALFKQYQMRGRGLIVGVDIGMTTAIALLDLNGNFIGLKSQKEFPQHEMQQFIQNHGQPVLFTTDVTKAPVGISKLAASFNVRAETPQKDLGRREKGELASVFLKKLNKTPENFHEVSALAAAIVCYNKHESKFRKVERQLSERGVFERVEEIKKKVLYGISVNRVLEGRG